MIDPKKALQNYREQIDKLDETIVQLLATRMELAEQVGELKKQSGLPIMDEAREEELKEHLKELAGKEGLDHQFLLTLFQEILKESRKIQG